MRFCLTRQSWGRADQATAWPARHPTGIIAGGNDPSRAGNARATHWSAVVIGGVYCAIVARPGGQDDFQNIPAPHIAIIAKKQTNTTTIKSATKPKFPLSFMIVSCKLALHRATSHHRCNTQLAIWTISAFRTHPGFVAPLAVRMARLDNKARRARRDVHGGLRV